MQTGKFHDVMWTVLDATANAGSNTLTLKHPVDWEVGNKIAIASTGNFLSQGENEQHTIAAISGDGRTLTLEVGVGLNCVYQAVAAVPLTR